MQVFISKLEIKFTALEVTAKNTYSQMCCHMLLEFSSQKY
jgi:hypothetical protein